MSTVSEYKYYSVYTNTILEKLKESDEYQLKNDDYIIVTVKNTNITIGTQLKNFLYKLIGKDTYTIGTSASALVVNNSQSGLYMGKIEVPYEPEPTPDPGPEQTPAPPEDEGCTIFNCSGGYEYKYNVTCSRCGGDAVLDGEVCTGEFICTQDDPHGVCGSVRTFTNLVLSRLS